MNASEEILVRPLTGSEIAPALDLARRVFHAYEAPDYGARGTAEFERSLASEDYMAGIGYYGAFLGEELVGMLGVRERARHICFLFVEGAYHRRGIGRKLLDRALRDYPGQVVTLRSSPYAVGFYLKCGFTPLSGEKTVNGIRFTEMECQRRSPTLPAGPLLLRPFGERDRAALIALARDECVKKTYMMPDLPTETAADAFFCSICALSRADGRFVYAIDLDGVAVGMINEVSVSGGEIEVGYAILPAFQNRGYATLALTALIGELFRLSFERVTAGYFEGNEASRRVMEKSGMRRLGTGETVEYRGEKHRVLYYASDRGDRKNEGD